MEYGSIQGVDKPVSRLVQGTMTLQSDNEEANFALLDGIYEQGGRAFDTAHVYGREGSCERSFGDWIKSRGVRDEIAILGKGAHPYDGRNRVTPEDIADDIRDSLKRMQVSSMDMYLLHRDDPSVPVGPIVEALNHHHRQGQIGAFGGSNWTVERVQEANAYAAEHGLIPFTTTSPNYSLAVQVQPPWPGCVTVSGDQGEPSRTWYDENNVAILPWSSLGGGFFSGRFRRDNLDQFTEGLDKLCVTSYCNDDNFQRYDRASELATHYGMTIPQVAMTYALSQPQAIFPLVGCRTAAEFADNAQAVGHTFTQAERDWVDLTSDERPW